MHHPIVGQRSRRSTITAEFPAPTAESINRDLDDTLYLSRAHSVGHARQHLNLLGYALIVNAVALHRHAKRRTPDRHAA